MNIDDLLPIRKRAIFAVVCVSFCFAPGPLFQSLPGQALPGQSLPRQDQVEIRTKDMEAKQVRLLIEQILNEGITQAELDSSAAVMQDLTDGRISEQVAHTRLKRFGDGKLVKHLSNRLFRHLFRRADPTGFFRSLRDRGLNTASLEEMQASINFYFRPQTESSSAQWEFMTNSLLIPIGYNQPGTDKVRSDLLPYQINTLIHELDHAEQDLRYDLFRMRGKSLGGKVHAGICWGGSVCFLSLIVITFLGSLHRLKRFFPVMVRLRRLEFLTLPQTALCVIGGTVVAGVGVALVYHVLSSAEFSDLGALEQENSLQIARIAEIIDMTSRQELDPEWAARAAEETLPRRIREAFRFGVPGALGGAALGLLLGWLGFGPRLLGKRRILKAVSYPWAMAITCALIGAVSFLCIGAWRMNQFSKFQAWEVSAYYSGDCVQQVLEGQIDIAFYNTDFLEELSLEDLIHLRTLDERGQFKLLLSPGMLSVPAGQPRGSYNPLAQLASDFPGQFKEHGIVRSGFEAFFVGVPIDFPYEEHPQIFECLFRSSLGLGLDKLTFDAVRGKFNHRGLADFMERSDLPFCVQTRDQVRKARAARIGELTQNPPVQLETANHP